MIFPTKPKPLEEVLISFMTICELPVGDSSLIPDNIFHVVVELDTNVENLPNTLDDMQTISVKLKCKNNTRWHSSLKTQIQLLLKHYIIC